MYDVENLSVNIDEPWGDEESTWSHKLNPLFLLKNLDFFLRRNFLLHLRILELFFFG